MSRLSRWLCLSASWAVPLACGGVAGGDGAPRPSVSVGGRNAGGSNGGGEAGGAAGGEVTGGGAPGVGGKPVGTGGSPSEPYPSGPDCVCTGATGCDRGDVSIAAGQLCPSGSTCYSPTCCGSVVCAHAGSCAAPTCNGGDVLIPGSCKPGYACYQRAVCGGMPITCFMPQRDAGAADAGSIAPDAGAPDARVCARDINHRYAATDAIECSVLDLQCPPGSSPFHDTCGCGCAQPLSCPSSIMCPSGFYPNVQADPLCGVPNACPFSGRPV